MITQIVQTFTRHFALFRRYAGRSVYLIVVLSILMGYAEGLGIAMIFPIFQGPGVSNDPISTGLFRVFAVLGVPPTPAGALPLVLGAFVLKGVLQFVTLWWQVRTTARVAHEMRTRTVAALTASDYLSVTRDGSGFLANLFASEIPRAAKAFLYFTRAMAPAVNAFVLLAIVALLDWQTTAACLLMGLIGIGLLRISGRVAQRTSKVTAAESASLTALLIQLVQGFKYLRTTGSFPPLRSRVDTAGQRLTHADEQSGAAASFVAAISQPLMVALLVGLLYYRSVIRGDEVSGLFVLLTYFLRIMTEVFTLQVNWQAFFSNLGSVEVVETTLARMTKREEPRGTQAFGGLTHELAAKDLSFAYQEGRPVLQDISLRIPACSTVAFVGESGSGKSTLCDVLSGTLRPSQGAVLVDDQDLATLDIERYRQTIGYVPQESVLFDDTIRHNLTLWKELPLEDVRDAARRAKALDFIEAHPLGLDAPIGDRGVMLSGGQRQRLAIARELLKAPSLMILDEATSALDSESERAIQQSIETLRGQMTILIIAHRLSTIRNCDVVYVLHEGRIVEQGTYDELVARPGSRFQRMIELQRLTEPVTSPA